MEDGRTKQFNVRGKNYFIFLYYIAAKAFVVVVVFFFFCSAHVKQTTRSKQLDWRWKKKKEKKEPTSNVRTAKAN